MPSRELLIHHLTDLLEQIKSSESDAEAWRHFRRERLEPWLEDIAYHRISRLERKVDELLERPNTASCRFSGDDSRAIARFLTEVGETGRSEAVRYLRDCLAGARQLMICDPYFLQPYGRLPKSEYLAAIADVLPQQLAQIELFVKPRKRDAEIAGRFNELCKARNIKLTCRKTDAIHDRVWIVDSARAYVVGTSFNGLGNKCAFILDLPDEDMKGFFREVGLVREQTTRSKSA